jgi:hypothetical protein
VEHVLLCNAFFCGTCSFVERFLCGTLCFVARVFVERSKHCSLEASQRGGGGRRRRKEEENNKVEEEAKVEREQAKKVRVVNETVEAEEAKVSMQNEKAKVARKNEKAKED